MKEITPNKDHLVIYDDYRKISWLTKEELEEVKTKYSIQNISLQIDKNGEKEMIVIFSSKKPL